MVTHDETRARYLADMGPDLCDLFLALQKEFCWMRWRWQQHEELFRSDEKRIDLMNEAAPGFFGIVQSLFVEDVILATARLVSAPQTAGKSNLTIQRLSPFVATRGNAAQIESLIRAAVASAEFATDWRNRHLAHRDLDLVLERAAPLKDATYAGIESALLAIEKALNGVQVEYCDSSMAYSVSPIYDSAKLLLCVLHDGVARGTERQAEWLRDGWKAESANPYA